MEDELAQSLGRAARAARKALSLTQEDVAERVDISTEFYARIERGHALPSVSTLARLAGALGLSIDALLARRGQKAAEPKRAWGEDDRPELRRALRRLRRASPQTLRAVSALLRELERER